MDSPYFLIPNNATSNSSNLNNDLEQSSSSSSFSYDPFDGFPFLDQQELRLYDYFNVGPGGGGGGGGGAGGGTCGASNGRNSPLMNHFPLDQLDIHQKNFPFQTDPTQEDEDDLQGTLTSFVGDLGGVDSDAGYTSGVDLLGAGTSIVDCSDSTETYYLRLALEQNNSINGYHVSSNNHSDINDNNYDTSNTNVINSNNNSTNSCGNINNINDCNSYISYTGDSNTSQKAKRSVLMNLLIDGSDVGAGYTSYNCRALPQRISTQHRQLNHHHHDQR